MSRFYQAVAIVTSLALTACASIIEGSTDTINVKPQPNGNVTCTLTSGRESLTANIPATVSVKKSRTDMMVDCLDSTNQAKGNTRIASDIEPWAFGNILFGGLIGLGIDWYTGAAYNYPNDAVVLMVAPIPAPSADAATPATNSAMPAMAPASVATGTPSAAPTTATGSPFGPANAPLFGTAPTPFTSTPAVATPTTPATTTVAPTPAQ